MTGPLYFSAGIDEHMFDHRVSGSMRHSSRAALVQKGRPLARRPAAFALLLCLTVVGLAAPAGCSPGGSRPVTGQTSAPHPAPTPSRSTAASPPTVPSTVTAPSGARAGTPSSTTALPARYVFPVRGCPAAYGHVHHDYPATDIFARPGCAYVAPTDGMVDEVSAVDRWSPSTNRGADRGGLSVSIVGVDGVRYYGSHFSWIAPGIAHGTPVRAGQLVARLGNSGDARSVPTHVHFGLSWPTGPGLWWVRRGVLSPWPYLDAWRAGRPLSPAAAIRAARAAAGTPTPPCQAGC